MRCWGCIEQAVTSTAPQWWARWAARLPSTTSRPGCRARQARSPSTAQNRMHHLPAVQQVCKSVTTIASHVPAMLGLAVTSALCSMVNLVLLCGPEGLGQKGYGQHQLFSTSCLCASCRTGALAIQQGGPPRPCCTVGQGAGQPQTTLCASSWTAFLSSKYFSESEQLLNFKACCLQKEALPGRAAVPAGAPAQFQQGGCQTSRPHCLLGGVHTYRRLS